jgi:hypothetical protein
MRSHLKPADRREDAERSGLLLKSKTTDSTLVRPADYKVNWLGGAFVGAPDALRYSRAIASAIARQCFLRT